MEQLLEAPGADRGEGQPGNHLHRYMGPFTLPLCPRMEVCTWRPDSPKPQERGS